VHLTTCGIPPYAQEEKLMHARALILILLAGCATTPPVDLKDAQNSWNGAQYDAVVLRWGAPTRSTVLSDGRDAHTWLSESYAGGGSWFPSIGVFGGSGGGVGVGVGTGMSMGGGGGASVRCERTLFFKQGRVVEQSWQGQTNYCSSFRRS
jgi:hypothetical protein